MAKADTHCLSKSPRSSCKVDQGRSGAATPHEVDSIHRLKSAQQDASPNSANFAANIYQEV
jgi:hypothetical protein